jgi:O-antigen ligase
MFAAFQRVSLFLVGVTIPIQGYSFLDFAFGMTPFKLATALLLVVGTIKFASTGRRPGRDRKTPWMLVFLASYLISCATGFLGGIAITDILIVASTYVSLVLYYFLIGYVATSQRDVRLLLWALLIGGAITAAPAFLGFQRGADIGYGERFTGLAGQANLLGFDMAVCFPIGAAFFLGGGPLLRRLIALGLATACLLGLFLSLSRSALVSFATMGAYWVVRAGRAGSVKYLLPVAAMGVGLAIVAPEPVMERVDSMLNPARRADDGSIQSRLGQIPFALKAFATNPVVGIGVLRFVPWTNEQRGGSGQSYEVHNAYLGVAVEQGLLGLIPYLGILALTWTDFSRCLRELRARAALRDPELADLQHIVTFLQIALLGILVGGLFGMAQKSKSAWLVFALSPVVLAVARARILALTESTGAAAQPARAYPPARTWSTGASSR